MIRAEFNDDGANVKMKGDLADVMAEFICGTLALLEAIENVNADAALVVRNDLITELAKYRPGRKNVQVVEKDVQ